MGCTFRKCKCKDTAREFGLSPFLRLLKVVYAYGRLLSFSFRYVWRTFAQPKLKAMENFKIRSYGRTELAIQYNPHLTPQAAWRALRHWIALNVELSSRLASLGYADGQRRFTPAMVKAIVELLGEP